MAGEAASDRDLRSPSAAIGVRANPEQDAELRLAAAQIAMNGTGGMKQAREIARFLIEGL